MYGYGYYGLFWDPTYVFVLIGVVICLAAQAKLRSTYAKYERIGSLSGMTGAEAAQTILRSQGIYDVQVIPVSGELTDHYDPRDKTVHLSQSIYGRTSLAAVAVAAHECGHAVQDANGYVPLRLRGAMVPVVNFGAQISWPLILIGILLRGQTLVSLGILLFSLSVIFQLVTLPVEFNASRRALALLENNGILQRDEISGARSMLGAAAMTYVAAAAGSLLQLLRLLILFGGNRRDN